MIAVIVIADAFRGDGLAVHSVILAVIGAALFACGIALAVWARLHLGRNWGMPMTQRAEPELVTSGPYRFVRHPIYSGLLTAMLGTVLVNNLLGLIVVAVLIAYFYYCGTVEERNLVDHLPGRLPGVPGPGRRCSSRSCSRRASAADSYGVSYFPGAVTGEGRRRE